MKKAAVIGLGDISGIHIDALQANPAIAIVGVCDICPEAAQRYPDLPFFTDYKQMIAQTRPDCVHICLPHHLHYPVAQELAAMGIHIFCEKPLALNARQAARFAQLEQEYPQLKMGVCLQNRMNDTVEQLARLLQTGQYGKITGIRGLVPWYREKAYYDAKPWRGRMETAGGGCMINQSIHTLDLMYLLGGEIVSLRGSVSQLLDYGVEVEDTATARLYFKNGATGLFLASIANSSNQNVELLVTTEKATFAIRDEALWEYTQDGPVKLAENARLPGEKFYYGASHRKLINRFYRALEEDTQDYIHAWEGVMSMRLIDAIQASSREKQAVQP